MDSIQDRAVENAELSQPNNPKRMPERSYAVGNGGEGPATKIRKLDRMFSLTSDIFRDVLIFCSRCDLNEITQATRQLNKVVQDYFQDQPFIPINGVAFMVNPPKSCADMLVALDEQISKLSWNSIWSATSKGLGEKLFRARRIVLFFNNGFEIESDKIRMLENISAMSTNSIVSIMFDHHSFFNSDPQTLSPLGDLLNILTSKCGRLRFDLKAEDLEEYSFPLLEYPSLIQYKEIEFSDAFAKYLNKDDVIEFLHQKSENQRMNPIRMRILFPEIEWVEYLIRKIVARFEQATEISAPFQLQFCLSSSYMMYFDELSLKNSEIGETLRYSVSKDEELLDTQRHTIERAPEA